MPVRQASWSVPAGERPAQVRPSSRLVVSVAWWKVTTTAKRTQRLCGDIILGFEHEAEARRFLEAMRERLSKYSLTLHPDKTRLLAFGRFAADQRARMGLGKPETFNFLGFTFISGKSREGKFLVRRKSRRDRVKAKLKEIKVALRANMHKPIPEQGTWLGQVVRGYFAYHAVPTNLGTLVAFHHYVSDLWLRTLRRRSQKDRKAWTDMTKMAAQWLPRPRVQHPWPNQRFAVKYPRWKPDAGKAACPVLCGGRVVIRVPTAIFISSLSP